MAPDAIRLLIIEMVRAGLVTDAVVNSAADEAEAQGKPEVAHDLRCLILRADETPAADWQREQADRRASERRARLTTVDGGKTPTR